MNISEDEVKMGTEAIATKIRIPKEIKEKIYNRLVLEFCMAIGIFVYFFIVNFSFSRVDNSIYEIALKGVSGGFALISLVIFEIGYRKDSGVIAIRGIEVLALALITLFMPYIYTKRSLLVQFLYSFSSMYIAIYYSIKALIMYEIEVRKYKNGISDIKVIMSDEDDSYLDDISERKFDQQNVDESEIEAIVYANQSEKVKKRKREILNSLKVAKKLKSKVSKEKEFVIEDEMVNKEVEDKAKEEVIEKTDEKKVKRGRKKKEEKVENAADEVKKPVRRRKKKAVQAMATASRRRKKGEDDD